MATRNFHKLLFLLIIFCFLGRSHAQPANVAYPAKSLRVIIPGAAGDTCDMMLRMIGFKFQEKTGMSFVMDNRVGASAALPNMSFWPMVAASCARWQAMTAPMRCSPLAAPAR